MFSVHRPLWRLALACAAAMTLAVLAAPHPQIAAAQVPAKPTIVLVHGAWADASSWNGVITRLESAGYTVAAPPNLLRGVANDGAYIASFLKTVPGPVVLVGHSYAGMVISLASATSPQVKALVYIDAFVPDQGDSVGSLLAKNPGSQLGPQAFNVVPFATATGGDADLYIKTGPFVSIFASGVPAATATLMAATQRPFPNSIFTEKLAAVPGWKAVPSWYLVGDADLVIPPATQLWMAQRINAHISHVNGGHANLVSNPDATTAAVLAAAKAVGG